MGIRINTNVASLNTQRHLYNNTSKFQKSMEKLSSGLRINRAGDDAAGLAISEGLKSDIRALDAEVQVIPRVHGSAIFQRGETQVLNVCTLGMPKMDQLLDNLGDKQKKRYMHHYNMPPFATGEADGAPHEALFWRSGASQSGLIDMLDTFKRADCTIQAVDIGGARAAAQGGSAQGIVETVAEGCKSELESYCSQVAPGEQREGYRMIGAIIPVGTQLHFVKAYGPKATMANHADEFRTYVEALASPSEE